MKEKEGRRRDSTHRVKVHRVLPLDSSALPVGLHPADGDACLVRRQDGSAKGGAPVD